MGSYHYVSGIDMSLSTSLAAYINSLTYSIEEPPAWFTKGMTWKVKKRLPLVHRVLFLRSPCSPDNAHTPAPLFHALASIVIVASWPVHILRSPSVSTRFHT
ncbi:hypothetical protein BC827DRAFT_565965 [Russula dissimulans]|nr:hypothetical protein BC827DRAFT_565965 [Russula dissimulans]